jgi:small subunit ribosomal protein S6
VIKFTTVRWDEEEKRLAKVKALRDSRVKRSAQPIAPQSVPAPAADAPSVSAAAETPAPEAPSASAEPEAKSAEPVAAPA